MTHSLSKTLSSFIWHFLRPYKTIVSLVVFLAILAGFWGPFNSMLLKHIINVLPELSTGNIAPLVWPATLILLNFIVFDNITWRLIGYINYKFQPVIKNQIIRETLNFVLGGSHQFFQDNLSGRISSQIITLADNIELILHRISFDFIRGVSLLVVSFIAAYSVNPAFFYTLLLWFLAFSSFSIFMSKRLVSLADIHAKSESVVSGQLVDCITNHHNVRIFSKKDYEISRMGTFLSESQKAFQVKEFFIVILCTVQGLMIATMMGAAIYFLVYLYGKGLISIGDFALILGLSMELGHMMWYTMSRVDDFNQAIGKCKQSLSALIVEPEINDRPESRDLRVQKGQIKFSKVKFHYQGTESLFQNKSVTIESGQKVGLVGYSGSGKSTFVNLILRLYDVTDGQILIDDQDIRHVTQDSLRRYIAMIPQDPSLFHRSLMDNIRYSKTDASDEEVIEAAKKAHAHEFIQQLPQGYDSLVGERGIKLSGGQRQRIAIARAILKNAPILMLDEATSQLDSVTESLIQESLWGLMQDKTTIVIAHRLSTLLHMDRILVFDHGKIIEDGTHAELLRYGGLYKTLWEAQVGGFLPDKKELEGIS
jgi:ATP-binding cassette, subfamily B, bacterial